MSLDFTVLGIQNMIKHTFSDKMIDVAVSFWVKTLSQDEDEAATEADDFAMLRLTLDGVATGRPAMASVIANVRQSLKPSKDKVEVFAAKLRTLLHSSEREYGVIGPDWVDLKTDYEPQGLLRIAANEAQVSNRAFPFKTTLTLKGTQVFEGSMGTKILYDDKP